MQLIYVLENYLEPLAIGNYTTLSTHATYIATNLANERPSKPYRTTGIGGVGVPEYVCVDLGGSYEVTFVGIFNHNFTLMQAANDSLVLKACATDCGTCIWAAPADFVDLTTLPAAACNACVGDQPISNFKNLWHEVDFSGVDYQYWRLEMIDTTNTDGYLELGELVLGQYAQFPRGVLDSPQRGAWVRLTPGRVDGPEFFMGKSRTHWGQDWSTYYSECDRFELKFTVQNDPCIVDAMSTFLKTVQRTGGRFVIVPDDDKPFAYYVIIDNLRDYAERTIYGRTGELREWRLRLKTLTEGQLLG